MQIVRIEAVERPVQIQADKVLPSKRYVFDSGNSCAVTPAMTSIEAGQCRVIINFAWVRPPSPEEQHTMEEYLRMLGMWKPEFLQTSLTRSASERVGNEWLNSGKMPGSD